MWREESVIESLRELVASNGDLLIGSGSPLFASVSKSGCDAITFGEDSPVVCEVKGKAAEKVRAQARARLVALLGELAPRCSSGFLSQLLSEGRKAGEVEVESVEYLVLKVVASRVGGDGSFELGRVAAAYAKVLRSLVEPEVSRIGGELESTGVCEVEGACDERSSPAGLEESKASKLARKRARRRAVAEAREKKAREEAAALEEAVAAAKAAVESAASSTACTGGDDSTSAASVEGHTTAAPVSVSVSVVN